MTIICANQTCILRAAETSSQTSPAEAENINETYLIHTGQLQPWKIFIKDACRWIVPMYKEMRCSFYGFRSATPGTFTGLHKLFDQDSSTQTFLALAETTLGDFFCMEHIKHGSEVHEVMAFVGAKVRISFTMETRAQECE